jgi:hypothetical protein
MGKDSGIDFMTIMIVVKLLSLGLFLYLWLWRGMTFWRSFGIYCLVVIAAVVIVGIVYLIKAFVRKKE